MKKSIAAIIPCVFSLAACIPPANLPAPKNSEVVAPVLDRFEAESYVADEGNNKDLQGLWIMTTKNFKQSDSTKNSRTGYSAVSEVSGSFRMACTIRLVEGAYNTSCFGADSITLSGAELSNSDGSWMATVNDNTHMSGSYSYSSTVKDSFKGITSSSAILLDFEMVKINSVDVSIGTLSLTVNDVAESSDINEFYETELLLMETQNGVVVTSETQTSFNAFGSTGALFGKYSQPDGASILANTTNLSMDASQVMLEVISNNTENISMSSSGVDNNSASFTTAVDIVL